MDNDGDRVRPEVVRMVTAIADALVAESGVMYGDRPMANAM
jgi:hypothetical protein